jgi:8-oxo-dGTP pyrophosphatase MutT (NUDIX family)
MTPAVVPKAPVTAVPAATLMLLRDGPEGVEVLMTARHDDAGFAAGAMVFPGGKVDDEDRRRASAGAVGTDLATLALPIAAIREAFEECGILLARRHGGKAVLSRNELINLLGRQPLITDYNAIVDRDALVPATDLLVPFAHWITPVDQPKRFDTHFFLAPAPVDQVALHDGHEIVEVRWFTPAGAIAAAKRGEIKLVLATRLNLVKLGRSGTVAEAIETARRSEIVTVQPELMQTADGPAFRIPAASGYDVTQVLVSTYRRA